MEFQVYDIDDIMNDNYAMDGEKSTTIEESGNYLCSLSVYISDKEKVIRTKKKLSNILDRWAYLREIPEIIIKDKNATCKFDESSFCFHAFGGHKYADFLYWITTTCNILAKEGCDVYSQVFTSEGVKFEVYLPATQRIMLSDEQKESYRELSKQITTQSENFEFCGSRTFLGKKTLSEISTQENDMGGIKEMIAGIHFLATQIPVFYVEKKEITLMWEKLKEDIQEYYSENIDSYLPSNEDVLGYYAHKEIAGRMSPVIYMCPELIKEESDKLGIDYDILYESVLVHELGHAIMDAWNIIKTENDTMTLVHPSDKNGQDMPWEKFSFYRTLPEIAMEESMANCITLNWFNCKSEKEYNAVKNFIGGQKADYQFGLYQHRALADWQLWHKFKTEHIFCDNNGVRYYMDGLRKWFDFCFYRGQIRRGH